MYVLISRVLDNPLSVKISPQQKLTFLKQNLALHPVQNNKRLSAFQDVYEYCSSQLKNTSKTKLGLKSGLEIFYSCKTNTKIY